MESIIKFWKKQQNHLWKSTQHLLNKNGTKIPNVCWTRLVCLFLWQGLFVCWTGFVCMLDKVKVGKFLFSIFTFYPPTHPHFRVGIFIRGPIASRPILIDDQHFHFQRNWPQSRSGLVLSLDPSWTRHRLRTFNLNLTQICFLCHHV